MASGRAVLEELCPETCGGTDNAAFGAWLFNQCRDNPEAQRLLAEWQQSKIRSCTEKHWRI